MAIIKADMGNMDEWTKMAVMLFPDSTYDDEFEMHKKILASENGLGLLYQVDNEYIGFMHLSIRNDYVNGTDSSPVLFVEALYIQPDYRKQGIGKAFLEYAEQYAMERGISQLASDCLIENTESEMFHKSCGFVEKERVICFVKDVAPA